jgi:lipopolysaccharide/colanic/teichoic acid biosynthesis glycosyltransferase
MSIQTVSTQFARDTSFAAPVIAPPSISRRIRGAGHRRPRKRLILAQDLFRAALAKERKRVDRSNQPLVLVLVALKNEHEYNAPSIWVPVIEALAAVSRETDVIGWYEWRSAIGLILPEIHAADVARAARELEAVISDEIVRRSDSETAASFSIRLHIQAEARRSANQERWPKPDPGFADLDGQIDWNTFYAVMKRSLDIVGSATLLVLFAPLFLLIAAAVKIKSPGPVLFRQQRVGQMMEPFAMLKFRTMYVDADHRLHQQYVERYINSSADCHEPSPSDCFKMTNDPRVTAVGRILRKTSLDELPQLWNVLRGEMSLVGPRPPIPYEVEQYKPWHCRRVLDAKPGITGLWQVTGRSRTTFDEMVRLDLRYAKTCSFWTDMKILLATPRAVISGRGAC